MKTIFSVLVFSMLLFSCQRPEECLPPPCPPPDLDQQIGFILEFQIGTEADEFQASDLDSVIVLIYYPNDSNPISERHFSMLADSGAQLFFGDDIPIAEDNDLNTYEYDIQLTTPGLSYRLENMEIIDTVEDPCFCPNWKLDRFQFDGEWVIPDDNSAVILVKK
jgi:hypothetical protein